MREALDLRWEDLKREVKALAEAQRRSEERVDRLEKTFQELAEAQRARLSRHHHRSTAEEGSTTHLGWYPEGKTFLLTVSPTWQTLRSSTTPPGRGGGIWSYKL